MSDDKSKTTQQDRIRVDAKDTSEVEYIHQQFPSFSHEQILEVIKQKGPLRADIMEYLRKK
jgi:hypothetical protein